MPDYYGSSSINPFVEGALAGFELFDRAADRRQRAEDRKQALAMEGERMKMAREDQAMQRENFELGKEDREIRLEKDRVAELDTNRLKAGKAIGDLAAIHGGYDKIPRDEIIRLTREGDPTRYASAGDDDVYKAGYGLMVEGSDWAENEAQRARERGERREDFNYELDARARSAEAVAARERARMEAGLMGVLQLASPQEQPTLVPPAIVKDTTPGPGGQRGGVSRGAAGAMRTGGEAAPPPAARTGDGPAPFTPQTLGAIGSPVAELQRTLNGRGRAAAEELARTRSGDFVGMATRDPVAHAEIWGANRDLFKDETTRHQLDALAYNGLKNRADQLRVEVEDARSRGLNREAAARAPQIERVQQQIRQLNTIRASDAIAAAAPRPVKPGAQAAAGVQDAIAAHTQMGVTPKTTQQELRLLTTQANRLAASSPKRLTDTQLRTVARAAALGVISPEAAMNFARTGQMEKPQEAKWHNAGEGRFLMTRGDQVIGIVDASGAPAVDGQGRATGSIKDTERRQRHEYLSSFAVDQLASAFESGEFSWWTQADMNKSEAVAGFFKSLVEASPALEAKYNLQLTDPQTGSITLGHLEQGRVAMLVDMYVKQMGDGKGRKGTMADYGPAGAGAAAQALPDQNGFSIEPMP